MRPFVYDRPSDAGAAVHAAVRAAAPAYLAGGTTLIDLMKLDVMRPQTVIDLTGLAALHGGIAAGPDGLHLGAFAKMADVEDHAAVKRDYPMIAQSLQLAASAQLRNMASLGGNVLQRTRCPYFRETRWSACNKREPGSGCAAMEGINRQNAVLGASDACIALYPGDLGTALAALDTTVEVVGEGGARTLPFEALHVAPGETPNIETTLRPGDLIVGFRIAAAPWLRRSLYLKVRDRQSYEFALASAAVALDLQGETVRDVRIGLGGVATTPWRSKAAEDALRGKTLTEASARAAGEAAFADAQPRQHNAYKIELGKRTLVRALMEAKALPIQQSET